MGAFQDEERQNASHGNFKKKQDSKDTEFEIKWQVSQLRLRFVEVKTQSEWWAMLTLMKERIEQFQEYFLSKKPYFLKNKVKVKAKSQWRMDKRNSVWILSPDMNLFLRSKAKPYSMIKPLYPITNGLEPIIQLQTVSGSDKFNRKSA